MFLAVFRSDLHFGFESAFQVKLRARNVGCLERNLSTLDIVPSSGVVSFAD